MENEPLIGIAFEIANFAFLAHQPRRVSYSGSVVPACSATM